MLRRKGSVAQLERLKMLPAAARPSPGGGARKACRSCGAAFDAFGNPLYRCSTCSEMFCHGCVPLRHLQTSYARICERCYKNLKGITRGSVLDLPPPDIASKLGELFNRGVLKPSAVQQDVKAAKAGSGGSSSRRSNPATSQNRAAPAAGESPSAPAAPASASVLPADRERAEALDRDVAAYAMLPSHVLEEFVRYFRRQEEKEVEQLSKWYEKKVRTVQAKIDALVAATAATKQPLDSDAGPGPAASATTPLRHPTKRRARLPSGERRLPTRRRSPPKIDPSGGGGSAAKPSRGSAGDLSMPPAPATRGALAGAAAAAAAAEPATKVTTPPPSSPPQVVALDPAPPHPPDFGADDDHPFHADVEGGEWSNPLADPTATLRGAAVLSPHGVDLWVHRGLSREGAEDLLLERDEPGSWLIRAEAGPRHHDGETVELVFDAGTGSPRVHVIDRTPTGLLRLGGHTVGRAGTLRALVQVLCSGESDTDAAADLPALSLDRAVMRDDADDGGEAVGVGPSREAVGAGGGQRAPPKRGSFGGRGKGAGAGGAAGKGSDDGSDEEVVGFGDDDSASGDDGDDGDEPALTTSAEAWLASVEQRYVHRGLSEQDAEDLLLSRDTPGSWLLREVQPDEAWGDAVEAEVAVDRGGVPTTYRVSQCDATGRLVIDGRLVGRSDTSVGALCAELGLGLGDVVLADGSSLELEWDPVHEGLSLEDAVDAVLGNGLRGSWLIRVPGSVRGGADLVLHTGDGPPLCLPLKPTERETLVFDGQRGVRVPSGEFASFEDLVARLTSPDGGQPAWLDLERAVPVWAVVPSRSAPVNPTRASAALPQTVLFDLLDGLLQGEVSRAQFDATVSKFVDEPRGGRGGRGGQDSDDDDDDM